LASSEKPSDRPPEVCRQRDSKGRYGRAARGELADFTGRDRPYEPPEAPVLVLRTAALGAEEAADLVDALMPARCGQPQIAGSADPGEVSPLDCNASSGGDDLKRVIWRPARHLDT
jgi:hypothetical protein